MPSKKDKQRKINEQLFFDMSVEFGEDVARTFKTDDAIVIVTHPKNGKGGAVNFFSNVTKQQSSMILASVASKLMNDVKKEQ